MCAGGAARTVAAMELIEHGAGALARLIRDGAASSREVVETHLERIAARNGELNAVRVTLAERALAAADEADGARSRGDALGPLHGVPVTVKENVDVEGTATTLGVAALEGAIAPSDAPAVAHLRAAGAIVIGRTNMPDFAIRWHTDSGVAGPTVNPHDPALTPGGSSGGEAVALATGMTPLGVGTDLGGSLRYPAQCCAVASLRPSPGRIPNATAVGATDMPISLQLMDSVGPMARSVEDLRVALEVMGAPSPRDPWSAPLVLDGPPRPRRVAVVADPLGEGVDPGVAAAVAQTAAALADAGYEIEEAEPPGLAQAVDVWAGLLITDLRGMWPMLEPVASDGARRFLELVFEAVPALDGPAYAGALMARQALARAWGEWQERHTLILGPISTAPPFAVGADVESLESMVAIQRSLRLTVAVNALSLPAVALPQGVQLIGPRYREDLCLAAAADGVSVFNGTTVLRGKPPVSSLLPGAFAAVASAALPAANAAALTATLMAAASAPT